jgi:DNA invertase Pin-like site-specific DNA recombinase
MSSKNVVAYYRVSTQKQGASGLGLDAQRNAVEAYCNASGCVVARSYTECETGTDSDRPVLAEALAFARRAKLPILVGALDRLSRNLAFIATILDSNVEFAACDYPNASRLLLGVMGCIAENEARAVSTRTCAALAVAKF